MKFLVVTPLSIYQFALRYDSLPSERRSLVTRRSGHHGQAAPVGRQNSPGVWADAVAL